MKRLFMLLCAVVAFAACEQAPIEEAQGVVMSDRNLEVSFEGGDDTRIQLQNGKTVWTKGDHVSVFYRSNVNEEWQFMGETGDRTGQIVPVDNSVNPPATHNHVVVAYPYSADYFYNTETHNVEASLPAVQSYLKDSYGTNGNIMISSSEFNKVSLKSVCGWLKLQLTGDGEVVKSITLRGNDGEQVAGLLYVDSATATATLASAMGDAGDGEVGGTLVRPGTILTEVTLDCGEGVALGKNATAFYIALPPQTFEKGLMVDVNCKGYNTMNISTQKVVTIERNHIQPMAEVAFSSEVRTVANNEIWYTATEKIERASWTVDTFGANIVSHEWDATSGEGIITFDSEISIIGDYAFDNCDILKTIDFNKSITSVGRYAFSNCDALSQIVIPGNIESVGYKAFENCTNVSSIIIEAGNTDLWLAYSFDGIPSTTLYVDRDIHGGYNNSPFENAGITTISIGPNMKNINMFVFSNCKNIQGFNVDSSSQLESIGYAAFYNSKITGLHIPNSVTHIDSSAFAMTSGMGWFSSNSSIYGVGMNGELYTVEKSLRTIFRWPDEFGYAAGFASSYHYDKIGDWAFSGIDNLKYFDILMYDGNTIEIGDSAFWNCNNLETFEAGYGGKMSISSIGSSVFGYTAIKELNFLDSSFDTVNGTFRNCLDLETLYLPGTLLEIGERTFENCSNLVSVFLASIVPPSLSVDAFNVVPNGLTIYVPAETVSIYKTTEVWSNYADYIVGYDFENGVVVEMQLNNEIWYTSSDGNVVTPYKTNVFGATITLNEYNNGMGIITFDGDVTMIGDYAFYNCDKFTSITLPECVTSIGQNAFYDCDGFTEFTIPDSVTTIGSSAFYDCDSLTSVNIPDSVTEIGWYAFENCTNLTSVYCKATTPPALGGASVFDANGSGRKIYVPTESVEMYKSTTGWSSYADSIVGYDFENGVVVE